MIKFGPGKCCCNNDVAPCRYYEPFIHGGAGCAKPAGATVVLAGDFVCNNEEFPESDTVSGSGPAHVIFSGEIWKNVYDDNHCHKGMDYFFGIFAEPDTRVIICLDPGDGTGVRKCFEFFTDATESYIAIVDFDFDSGTIIATDVRIDQPARPSSMLHLIEIYPDMRLHQGVEADMEIPPCVGYGPPYNEPKEIKFVDANGYTLKLDNSVVIRNISFAPTNGEPVKLGVWIESTISSSYSFILGIPTISTANVAKDAIGSLPSEDYYLREAACAAEIAIEECEDDISYYPECHAMTHMPIAFGIDFGAGGWVDGVLSTHCADIAGEFIMYSGPGGGFLEVGTNSASRPCYETGYHMNLDTPQQGCDIPTYFGEHTFPQTIFRSVDFECDWCIHNRNVHFPFMYHSIDMYAHFRKEGSAYLAEVFVMFWGFDIEPRRGYSGVHYQATQGGPYLLDSLTEITLTKISEHHRPSVSPAESPEECIQFYFCSGTLPESITLRGIHYV